MKKKNLLRGLEAVLFCAVVLVVLGALSRLLVHKEGKARFQPFLDKPQQYDVLFFGDSCFVNSMFPMEMWTDYGIPGYNLACYGNTLPITYWVMMNALDYAKPKVAVFAVNDVRKDIMVTGSNENLHTALDFWPMSLTKARAIEDLMGDPETVDDNGNHYRDLRWEYYFTLGKYHDRWSRLTPNEFSGEPNVQKGAELMVGVVPKKEYTLIGEDEWADEQGVGYAYMRKMIEECQKRDIGVLLVYLPYPSSEQSQMAANTVGFIAGEYDVPYINFLSLDSVADYETDCYDQRAHLNFSGGQKVTDYIGAYLAEHFGLKDRRGEAAYAGWAKDEQDYAAYKRERIRTEDKLRELLMLLHDDTVSASIAVRAQADFYWDDQLLALLHNTVREHVLEENAYIDRSDDMFPLEGLDEAVWTDVAYYLELDRANGTFAEYVGDEAEAKREDTFGAWEKGKEVYIRLFNPETGEQIAERQF